MLQCPVTVTAGLVQIGVAHAAIENVDRYIVFAQIAAVERKRREGGVGVLRWVPVVRMYFVLGRLK